METKFLVPREGVIVRNPVNMLPIPKGGAAMPWRGGLGRYWRRRVRVGDCIIVNTPNVEKPLKRNQGKEEK
jgi:hypothetical protein